MWEKISLNKFRKEHWQDLQAAGARFKPHIVVHSESKVAKNDRKAPTPQNSTLDRLVRRSTPTSKAINVQKVTTRLKELVGVVAATSNPGIDDKDDPLLREILYRHSQSKYFLDAMREEGADLDTDQVWPASIHPSFNCLADPKIINPRNIVTAIRWGDRQSIQFLLQLRCSTSNSGVSTIGQLALVVYRIETDSYEIVGLSFGEAGASGYIEEKKEGSNTTNEQGQRAANAQNQKDETIIPENFALGLGASGAVKAWLSEQRYLLIVGLNRTLLAYDTKRRRSVAFFRNVADSKNVSSLQLLSGRLLQISSSGQMHLYDFGKPRAFLHGYFVDDELIVYDQNGYYTATAEGAHFVRLKFSGWPGLHSLYQFRQALHRPELIKGLLLSGTKAKTLPRLSTPPLLSMTFVDAQPKNSTTSKQQVAVRIQTKSETTVKHLRFFADGSLLTAATSESSTNWVNDTQKGKHVVVDVPASARWLSAVAVDSNGAESLSTSVMIDTLKTHKGNALYFLGIGTDTYNDPKISPLGGAKADVRNIGNALNHNLGRYYTRFESHLLLDQENLGDRIQETVANISKKVAPDDTVLIQISSHGLRDDGGEYYLATKNTKIGDLFRTSISWGRLAQTLSKLRARVLLLVDTCHSGAAGFQTTNDAAIDAVLKRAAQPITVIAASKGRQLSHEDPKHPGGMFTNTIVELITRDRARIDSNRNGLIELSELYFPLKKRVVEKTKGRQTPWIARNQMVGEIPLF